MVINKDQLENVASDFFLHDKNYIETPWKILGSYFEGHHLERLVRHQIESYNLFVNHQIEQTIGMFNPVHIKSEQDYDENSGKTSLEIYITFENFNIYRPQIQEIMVRLSSCFLKRQDYVTLHTHPQ